ncbi:hypothetical protein FZC66_14520 [Priestia megaterium]|nr:hypothetical protein FZC66_14520 [Priestia megaterium]
MKKWLLLFTFIIAAFAAPFTNASAAQNYDQQTKSKKCNQQAVSPLSSAHAHNDYWHNRPLFDALDQGFTSVEADIFLVDGELLVGHDREELSPERTLKSLYLDPLMERVNSNHGAVYPCYKQEFLLWIDIKTDGENAYRVLNEQLRQYQKMLTKSTPKKVKQGAVTVIISGDRPRTLMENQRIRYAAYDGRLSDLGSDVSNKFMPVISDDWQENFTWMGEGEMPKEEREKLNKIVATAHANGQKVRFWANPDDPSPEREAVWNELLKAGVDLIGTGDLAGFREFMQ